jgi:heat shock protein HslJ
MKQLLLISCIALLGRIMCSSSPQIPRDAGMQVTRNADSMALAGEWYLRAVLPSDTAAGKLPMLRFNLAAKKFSGFTGCNNMSGDFTVRADQLVFDKNIVTTKIACQGYNEKEFLSNLLRVDHFRIKDSTLQLLIGQTPVSEWGKKPYIQKTL